MNRALQWKLIVGFLLVFAAGMTTGGFLGATYARHWFFFGPPHRGMIGERMRDHLRSGLDLTPDQLAKISPIIDKTAAQLEQTRRDTGVRVRQLFTDLHREISVYLTDEQRAKLQKLEARHRRWGHPHGRHGPPPEHGPDEEGPD